MSKSSQTSLTRFLAESGADTRERNRILHRGSLTHVSDFTAQSPCSPCTFRKRKGSFTDLLRRAVGGSFGGDKGKKFNFFPFEPFNPLIISRCYFLKTEQKRKSGKDCRFLFRKNADVHWFYAPFLAHFQIVSFRLFNYHAPPSINIMTQNPTHLCDFLA